MNRLSCLRLTERCADILLSVREEIYEAGDEVGYELAAPISKLEEYVSEYLSPTSSNVGLWPQILYSCLSFHGEANESTVVEKILKAR